MCMCVHSQTQQIDAIHPPCTARWNPRGRPPIDRVQVERPRSPGGASPVFGSCRGAYHHGVPGAAFFDLDRTLLAGASGETFSAAMRSAGFTSREHPGGEGRLRPVQPHRRDAAVDGARPPGGQPGQGSVACRDDRRRRGRGRRSRGDGATVRRAPVRGAPGRRAPDRARHDDAVRPRQAAGRTAPARRRRRHPLRRQRRRHLRRDLGRSVRLGGRQVGGRPRLGRRPRRRTGGELCVLGQLLRRAPALGGRDTDRRQPRPAHGRPRARCAGGRSSTWTCHRAW